MTRAVGAAMLLALVGLSMSGRRLQAQTVRASGSTSLRYIELRPFARDSVASTDASGDGLLRQLPDGSVVRCIPGDAFCYQVRAGEVLSTLPVIHDVNLSAWGFGRGVRLNAQLRGRSSFGASTDLWPRAEDHLEVLSLYGELERRDLRFRAGRQWRVSGLGFYNFDGLAVAWRRSPSTLLEAYGGRSLSRGLNEGRTGGALESIEDLSVPDAGILFGLQGRYRPGPRVQLGAVYQIDLRGDRQGAYSELLSADGLLRVGRGTADASVEIDLAGRALNHARVSYQSPPIGDVTAFVSARRYNPYFELWTIWGAFSPVGFDEGTAGLTWAPTGRLIARVETSYRRYRDAQTESIDAFRTSGWAIGGAVTWLPDPAWRASGSYRLESGFGAARWEGQADVRRDITASAWVSVQVVGFQRLYEFRLGEGTVTGAGVQGAWQVAERGRVLGSAMVYRQHGGLPSSLDWNQRRASMRFEWVLGGEPEPIPAGRPVR
jgi:hypothetical protein